MIRKLLVGLAAAASACTALAAPLQVSEFRSLPAAQQLHIIDASYNAVSVVLAFTEAERKGPTPAAKQLAACLRSRDPHWVAQALSGYLKTFRGTPTSLGGAVTQAMMWKCGVLVIEGS